MNIDARDLDFEDVISPKPRISNKLFVEDLEIIAEKVPESSFNYMS